jgi:hypothetical protein
LAVYPRNTTGGLDIRRMFESIRSAAVSKAVEQFTARVSTSPGTWIFRTGSLHKIRDHLILNMGHQSGIWAGQAVGHERERIDSDDTTPLVDQWDRPQMAAETGSST